MGALCGCTTIKDSEEFIKTVLTTTCLQILSYQQLDTIIASRTKGGNDLITKTNLELTKEIFNQIVNDIYQEKYNNISLSYFHSNKIYDPNKKKQAFENQKKSLVSNNNNNYKHEVKKFFDENFFSFLDYNNKTNSFMLKLLMCPFTLKESDDNLRGKVEYFFNCIKCVNFENPNADLTRRTIGYNQFYATFLYYLSCVLSGYSMQMLRIIKEGLISRELEDDLENHCNQFFVRNIIEKYLSSLTEEFEKGINFADSDQGIDPYEISVDDLFKIIQHSPQIINYWELRKDFLVFAHRETFELETTIHTMSTKSNISIMKTNYTMNTMSTLGKKSENKL